MALKHATTLAVAVERERATAVRTAERETRIEFTDFPPACLQTLLESQTARLCRKEGKISTEEVYVVRQFQRVSACHLTTHTTPPYCTTPLLRCAPPAHCTSSPPSFSHRPKIPQCIRCFSQLFPYIYVDMRVGRRPVLAKHFLNTHVGISARCFEKITSPKIFWHLVKFT